jgi:hypothetical protein
MLHATWPDSPPSSLVQELTLDAIEVLRRRITEEVLASHGTKVIRPVLFSFAHPVLGSWRYRDAFQIFPPPANAPLPQFMHAPYPFILECSYHQSTNGWVLL